MLKEYRICMPLSVEEYRIGQLYMICRHSHEQSEKGEGVHVVKNEECEDDEHGKGHFTEKRVYLSSKLPSWVRGYIPKIFYIEEKAWNFYPYTITETFKVLIPSVLIVSLRFTWNALVLQANCMEIVVIAIITVCIYNNIIEDPSAKTIVLCIYKDTVSSKQKKQCSFFPRFSIRIETRYENNNGCTENGFNLEGDLLDSREVVYVDIADDEVPEKYYVREEDCRHFKSVKTGRGPLKPNWRDDTQPIMCSYKLVNVHFDVWGLSQRVESFVHKCVQDVLLLGHRQAFAWIDNWIDMTEEEVRSFEKTMQEETNSKVGAEV